MAAIIASQALISGAFTIVNEAIYAGADAVDGALDSMSGLTSQPNLGAIVASLEGSERDPCGADTGVDRAALQSLSDYWEGVRP